MHAQWSKYQQMKRWPQVIGDHVPTVPETGEMCAHSMWVCLLVHISSQTSPQVEQEAWEAGIRQATRLGQALQIRATEIRGLSYCKNFSLHLATRDQRLRDGYWKDQKVQASHQTGPGV